MLYSGFCLAQKQQYRKGMIDMLVIKKVVPVQAFQLGHCSALEQQLAERGLLQLEADGLWRIRTREAMDKGELAKTGDYIKLDSIGMPYPTEKAWFEENHIPLEEGWYQQKVSPRKAWQQVEGPCPEIEFLLEQGLLHWDKKCTDRTFSAQLWGTLQTAAADAVIIFDSIQQDTAGTLTAVNFHFVAKEEFDLTYEVLEDA